MNKKEKLIAQIIEEDLKSIKKQLKDQEAQIKDIEKNGMDPEIHPDNIIPIQTGLSYTQGYCTGHIKLAEDVLFLLNKKDAKDIKELIKENKAIEKKNKKYMDKLSKSLLEKRVFKGPR